MIPKEGDVVVFLDDISVGDLRGIATHIMEGDLGVVCASFVCPTPGWVRVWVGEHKSVEVQASDFEIIDNLEGEELVILRAGDRVEYLGRGKYAGRCGEIMTDIGFNPMKRLVRFSPNEELYTTANVLRKIGSPHATHDVAWQLEKERQEKQDPKKGRMVIDQDDEEMTAGHFQPTRSQEMQQGQQTYWIEDVRDTACKGEVFYLRLHKRCECCGDVKTVRLDDLKRFTSYDTWEGGIR